MSLTQSKYTSKLVGATVLLIGGSSGVGFGLAEACIENQVSRIIISSSQQTKINTAISRLRTSYPEAATIVEGISCDMGNEDTFESNIEQLFAQIDGKIDHVVFTAGDALKSTPLDQLDFKTLKQDSLVRFFAPFFVVKAAVHHMTPGPISSITLSTGVGGDKPVPGRPVINAISSGTHGLVRALALDLRPVRVNVVSLGATDTELWETMLGPNSQERKAAMFKAGAAKMATGQVARVEDVVESFLSVLKDRNVTGAVVRSDGGIPIM